MSTNTENAKLLSPKLDVVFQRLFGEVGSEKITSRFLEVILKEKIDNIDLSNNPILRRDTPRDKLGILDVVAQFNDKEYCDIELQCYIQENIIERLLFYWSKLYSKQAINGKPYSTLHRTIVILISTNPVNSLGDLPYFTSWKIIEEQFRKTILTDKFEICIIDLSKIANLQNENDELLDWLFFLENPTSERVVEKMKKNEELKQAAEKLEQLSEDKHMQRMAWWRQKAIMDESTARNAGFEKGHEVRYYRGY